MTVKIVCISDTHTLHTDFLFTEKVKSLQGDILIHSGDFSNIGSKEEIESFINWFCSLENFKYKIFIAGNNDTRKLGENETKKLIESFLIEKQDKNIIYLENTSITVLGLKIYGSPYTPKHSGGFQYEYDSEKAEMLWDRIPSDCNILITHGPPYEILDKSSKGISTGCKILKNKVFQSKELKIHIFGHVHHSAGILEENGKWFINAAQEKGINGDKTIYPIEIFI